MYPIEVSDVIEYSVYLAASVCSEQPQDHDPGGLLAINPVIPICPLPSHLSTGSLALPVAPRA